MKFKILKKRNSIKVRRFLKGFTLVETLIAITVLTFAIAATFTAAQSGLSSAVESKNQVVGYYLAEEAVESIRNMRDSNSLLNMTSPPVNWLAGIAATNSDPCFNGKYCNIDIRTNSLISCGVSPCPNLVQDRASSDNTFGMYGISSLNSGWAPTNFNRQIQISLPASNSNNEAEITVIVTWQTGSQPVQTFEVRESLFNWQT